MRCTPKYLKARAVVALRASPLLWGTLRAVRGEPSGKACGRDTALCVEGFPGSANSYTVAVFKHLKDGLKVSHHTHSVANVKLALRYNVPSLILFRHPAEAIPSFVSRFRPGGVEATLRYIGFYKFIASVSDRVILASFEEVTTSIGKVVARVVSEAALDVGDYDIEAVEAEAIAYIQAWSEQHRTPQTASLPSEERARRKQAVKRELECTEAYWHAKEVYDEMRRLHRFSLERVET